MLIFEEGFVAEEKTMEIGESKRVSAAGSSDCNVEGIVVRTKSGECSQYQIVIRDGRTNKG